MASIACGADVERSCPRSSRKRGLAGLFEHPCALAGLAIVGSQSFNRRRFENLDCHGTQFARSPDCCRRGPCAGARRQAGEFYRHFHYGLFSYISHRIPEISDELYRVDDAMMAGFGWEIGAFESWDVLGVEKTLSA